MNYITKKIKNLAFQFSEPHLLIKNWNECIRSQISKYQSVGIWILKTFYPLLLPFWLNLEFIKLFYFSKFITSGKDGLNFLN